MGKLNNRLATSCEGVVWDAPAQIAQAAGETLVAGSWREIRHRSLPSMSLSTLVSVLKKFENTPAPSARCGVGRVDPSGQKLFSWNLGFNEEVSEEARCFALRDLLYLYSKMLSLLEAPSGQEEM